MWVFVGAKTAGMSHERSGEPCQDNFVCAQSDGALFIAVSDGAGSAVHSAVGSARATAQAVAFAQKTFSAGCDLQLLARCAVAAARSDVLFKAVEQGQDPQSYACTLLFIVLSDAGGAAAQIGDGVITVKPPSDDWSWVFWPHHGEYSNTTRFLTDSDALEVLETSQIGPEIEEIALTTDGLEQLGLHFATKTVHSPFYEGLFTGFRHLSEPDGLADFSSQLEAFLASPRLRTRADDDLTLVLATQKSAKVAAMTTAGTAPLIAISAWPSATVSDDRQQFRGFTMPRIASRADAHQLYSPKSRATAFPEADFRFLVHVAGNAARAFATVHAQGHVIGDINHGHMLVGQDGRCVLIDTDSFQVSIGGKRYTCDVGSPLFTPPELQGLNFRGLVRTPNHDCFGLAVILFHLLFMGRHPYAGVLLSKGDMPIEKAITERRFAYSSKARSFGMAQPPGTLPLTTFGPKIANLFERAFSENPDPVRPTALEWVDGLRELALALRTCSARSAHAYPSHLTSCPWCALEKATGVRLFGEKIASVGTVAVDISQLWQAIERIARPSPDPPLPSALPWTIPAGVELPSAAIKPVRVFAALGIGIAGAAMLATIGAFPGSVLAWLVLAIVCFFVWPRTPSDKRAALNAEIDVAKRALEQLVQKWNHEASIQAFDAQKQALLRLKAELDDLPQERSRRLAKLKAEQPEFQKRRHLDRFRIDRAKIPGIGSGRAAMLASFGMETAYDLTVSKVQSLSGFGPVLTAALLDWKRSQEASFRFNPNEPLDPKELARIAHELDMTRNRTVEAIKSGFAYLQTLQRDIPAARARLLPLLQVAYDNLSVAQLRGKRS